MELHFYEIPKFKKKALDKMTRAEKWLTYFAKQMNKEEADKMGAIAIRDAFDAANNFMLSEEQRLAYINREMAIMDYNTNMRASREEGLEDGWKKGKEEGRKEGIKEGRKEGIFDVVKNLIKIGIPMEHIRQASGLTDEAILELKDKV